jgi:hypothetical protein
MNTENDSNPGIEDVLQGDAEDTGSDGFFDSLEQQVNGQVYDDESSSQPEQVTQQEADPRVTGNEEVDWRIEAENLKQRYSDSSREAQRLKAELDQTQELTKFRPLIEHLKNDPAAVDALRNHLSGQAQPQFDEDFVFDAHEAVTDPDSDSSKALKQMIDMEADKRVNARLQQVEQKAAQTQAQQRLVSEVDAFKQKTGMNDTQFEEMQNWAQSRELTLEDIYYLKNKGTAAQNVANNTKQEMLNQMRNVQNIPTSASNVNSAPEQRSPDDAVFDILKGMDEGAENLFG